VARLPRRGKAKANKVLEPITSIAGFRRKIHSAQDLSLGISIYRKDIALENVPEIVESLLKNPIYRIVIAGDAFPESYSRIKSTRSISTAPPELELIWTANILAHFREEINSFVDLKSQYFSYIMTSNFSDAKATLDLIIGEFGHSIWTISAQLSLTQMMHGLSEQKALLDSIISVQNIHPITAYFAFFISYSLEDNVVQSEIRKELTSDNDDFTEYARYHLLPGELNGLSKPHSCISYEDNSPILDRYETYVEMLGLYCSRGEYIEHISEVLATLSLFKDVRLQALNTVIDSNHSIAFRTDVTSLFDKYVSGEYTDAIKVIEKLLSREPELTKIYEVYARTLNFTNDELPNDNLLAQLVNSTCQFLNLKHDVLKTRRRLEKLAVQLRKLPASHFIEDLLDRTTDVGLDEDFSANSRIACLSAGIFTPFEYLVLSKITKIDHHRSQSTPIDSSVSQQLFAACVPALNIQIDKIDTAEVPQERRELYKAYSLFNRGDYQGAVDRYVVYRSLTVGAPNPRTEVFYYFLLRKLEKSTEAMAAFTEAYLTNSRAYALFPLPEISAWAIAEASIDSGALDRSIVLHIYSQFEGPKYDGDLSDAFEDVLDYYGVQFPSELFDIDIDRARMIYFLRHVATIDRLEDTVRFESVDAIEDERIYILQKLVIMDPSNRTSYTQEISSITKDQEVARLSAQVDRSKIYVHEDGIRRIFEADIRPAFFRYRELLANPHIGSQNDQIERRLRQILRESDNNFGYLILPSTERDSIYFSMVQRAYDLLIIDPNHGFKTYLSTRILHGILEGELRKSFASEELLFPSDSVVPINEVLDRWGDRLNQLNTNAQRDAAQVLIRFSNKVTESITELKDERIRIYGQSKITGLFKIYMDAEAFEKLKTSLTSTTPYEEFVDRLLGSFWQSMEGCLRDVKIEINTGFSKEIRNAFDALDSVLSGLSPRPIEVLDAVARCRAAFFIDLERISAWFSRAGQLAREPFSVDTAVQVSSRITNNCYPKYPMKLDTKIHQTCHLSGDVLNPVVDLLTNSLQNAAEHSGFDDRAPRVEVIASIVPGGDLIVEVRSETSQGIDLDQARADISELLLEDDNIRDGMVAEEGKTGIRKMKRILRYDVHTTVPLQIDIDDSNFVRVRFCIPGKHVNANSHN